MKTWQKRIPTLATVLSAAVLLAACGGGGGSSNSSSSNGGGGAGPEQVTMVEVSSAGSSSIDVSWLPARDSTTDASSMRYQVHAFTELNYVPTVATLAVEGLGILSARLTGLQPATRYTIKLLAFNAAGLSSASLPLTVTTSSIPSETIPGVVVLTPTDAQIAAVADGQLTLTADATKPQVGQFIASTQGDGLLRRVTRVNTESGQTVVETSAASINQVVKNVEISSAFVLTSIPAEVPIRQAGIAVRPASAANASTEISWPQTSFRMSGPPVSRSAAKTVLPQRVRAQSNNGSNIDVSSQLVSSFGKWTTFSGPNTIGILTGTRGGADLALEVTRDDTSSWTGARIPTAICKVEIVDDAAAPGLVAVADLNPNEKEAVDGYEAVRRATPRLAVNATNIAARAEPYAIHLRAYIDEAGNQCQGSFRFFTGWKERLDIVVNVVVVSAPNFPQSESKKLDFDGDFNVSSDVNFTFDPRLEAEVKMNDVGRILPKIEFARLETKGRAEIAQKISVIATGVGTIDKTKELIEGRKFVKVYMAGTVPIVMSGEFAADLRVQGNVTGAITASQEINFRLEDIVYGLVYEGGIWRTSQNVRPTYQLKISGSANATANLNFSLLPRLSIKFYDTASGRLVINPYIDAEAGIFGQVIADITPTDRINDADYWLTQGLISGGIDGYVMADLGKWDRTFFKWPENANIADYTTFRKLTLVPEYSIAGLPTLTATADSATVHPTDSRAFLIRGQATEVPNPFKSVFGGPEAFLTFANWTVPKVLVSNDTGYNFVPSPENGAAGDVWIDFSNAGTFKVRLGGHSSMGGWARQIAEVDVLIEDSNNNSIMDFWEQRYGLQGSGQAIAAADPDADGLTNFQEWLAGSDPLVAGGASIATINTSVADATIGQTILVWLTGAIDTVRSVVWSFGVTVADAVRFVTGGSSEADTASVVYVTAGQQTITGIYSDASGTTVGANTVAINVRAEAPPAPTLAQAAKQTDGTVRASGGAASGVTVRVTWPNGATNDVLTDLLTGNWAVTSTATSYTTGQTVSVASFNSMGTSAAAALVIASPIAPGEIFDLQGDRYDELVPLLFSDERLALISYPRLSGNSDINLQMFDSSGTPIGGRQQVAAASVSGVSLGDGSLILDLTSGLCGVSKIGQDRFIVLWGLYNRATGGTNYKSNPYYFRAQIYSSTGDLIGVSMDIYIRPVGAYSPASQKFMRNCPVVTGSKAGGYAIAFNEGNSGFSEVQNRIAFYEVDGRLIAEDFFPDISRGLSIDATYQNGYLVSGTQPDPTSFYFGSGYARIYSSDGVRVGQDLDNITSGIPVSTENCTFGRCEHFRIIPKDDGGFDAIWIGGATRSLYVQSFGSAAQQLGGVRQLPTTPIIGRHLAAARLSNEKTLIAWTDNITGALRGEIVSNSGVLLGDPFQALNLPEFYSPMMFVKPEGGVAIVGEAVVGDGNRIGRITINVNEMGERIGELISKSDQEFETHWSNPVVPLYGFRSLLLYTRIGRADEQRFGLYGEISVQSR